MTSKEIVRCLSIPFFTLFSMNVLATPAGPNLQAPSYDRSGELLRYSLPLPEEGPSLMDDTNDYLSKMVLNFSEYIDHGIAKDEDEEALTNRSYIQITTSGEYSHRGYFDSDERINVRVDLPHTEHDWKLVLETDPDDYDDLESKQRGLSSSPTNKDGAFGGVRLEDAAISHWRTNFDIGVKIRFPIDPFTRGELYRVIKLSDDWTTKFSQELFYFNSKGLGSLTGLGFYYDVAPEEREFLKISASGQYLYDDDQWEVLHQVQYFDRLSEKHLMEYSVGVSLLPYEEKEVSNYWLSASWIQKLYKNWLFLTVTPEIEFPREYDYKFNPGIFIKLEAFFSKNRKANRLDRSIPRPTTND